MSITDPTKTGDERKNAGAHVGLVVPASYKSYITHIYSRPVKIVSDRGKIKST